MKATHIAQRMGLTTSTVTRLETSEVDDPICLASLRRTAEAMGCELQIVVFSMDLRPCFSWRRHERPV